MRYVCVHCDHRFEAEGSEVPKRCPSCMRAKGIEPVRENSEKASPRKGYARHLAWVGALAVVAFLVVWLTRPKQVEDAEQATRPLALDTLHAALAQENVDAGGLERLLVPDASIKAFAERSASDKHGNLARAEAVYSAIRARAKALAFVPWSLGEPRATKVMTAAQTLKAIDKDGARRELYPLEVAALGVAALRALEVDAMLAELVDLPGEKAPLDASGYLGYFVVAVYPEKAGEGDPVFFDVYNGRKLPEKTHAEVLRDTTAVGAALALRAVHENAYLADPKSALESSAAALRLAGRLPSVRTVRGVVVLTEKMIEQGLQEFQAARELRADAPRLHNVASVMLVTGDFDKAQSVLSAALQKAPDFASAHATLGSLLLVQGQVAQGRSELEKAEQLEPGLSLVQWGLADLALRAGERDAAIARGRKAYAHRPSFDAKLRLAALLRQAGKYEEMRKLAAELFEQTPGYRRASMREALTAVLGPTALEPETPSQIDPGADDLSDLGGPDLKLELPGAPLPGVTGGEKRALGGPAPKLQLRDPGRKLKLDLQGE